MIGDSREGAKARSTLLETGQWYGSIEDGTEAKAIIVLSIDSDRDWMATLQILPETEELPYLTIRGRIEWSSGICRFFPDRLEAKSHLEGIEGSDIFRAFQLSFAFGKRNETDRPQVERNVLESCACFPTRSGRRLSCRIFLRKRMAPCSSEWPLEQATTWKSFKDWALSENSSGWIFRGQADAGFSLVSSLHRRNRYDIFRYLSGPLVEALLSIKEKFPAALEQIEGLPNLNAALNGNIPDENDYKTKIFESLKENPEETLRITRYLRHHGYPTPILDWSTNHEVSAFFATEESTNPYSSDFVIYAFHYERLKSRLGKDPGHPDLLHPANLLRFINPKNDPLGPLNTREAPQSALYLWSGIHDLEGFIRWVEIEKSGITKDRFLRRFRFAGNERESVRAELKANGLSRFSLFGSVDSLTEDLTEESFSLKQ